MKILICDDSRLTLENLKDIMEKLGHEVVALAETGEEAVVLYPQTKPDICFMDITMPGMDGIATLRKLQQLDPAVKVIMCTGINDQMMMIDALSGGAIDFITKPYDEARIKDSLSKLAK